MSLHRSLYRPPSARRGATLAAVAACVALAVADLSPVVQAAPVVEHKTLTLEGAKLAAGAAAAAARAGRAAGAIAIVDEGGNLIYLERLDGTFSAAANISIGKARSAAGFQRDTRIFEDAIKNGRASLLANPELLPLQGGVPIVVDGQVVGAIGVSGANSAQQDEEIAKAGALAIARPGPATGGGR
jgi:glc operon protein GlcG